MRKNASLRLFPTLRSLTCRTFPPAITLYADLLFICFSLIHDLHANDKKTTRSHLSSLRARPSAEHTLSYQIDAPRQASNDAPAFGALSQSARGRRRVGGALAAPERDIEIVEERRFVGHECHSLRVLIIWRGVCNARPVRLSRWKSRRS